MLKTNVIKSKYSILIQNTDTGDRKTIIIEAESTESAKLKIPDGWEFVNILPAPIVQGA